MHRTRNLTENAKAAPSRLFYYTTITIGRYTTDMAFNPSKIEAFSGILLEKLKDKRLVTGKWVDEFDMTFPEHYDNQCNDNMHYGWKQVKERW